MGADDAFYGTTVGGGSNGSGTVFRVTTNGSLTTLFAFDGSNGVEPYGGLAQDEAGNLYGTTSQGGQFGYGTAFELLTNGSLKILGSFDGTNGAYPYSGLVMAKDGNLYGTTIFGGLGFNAETNNGNSGYSVVFRVERQGGITAFALFNGTNGSYARQRLIQASDGYLYGTASGGGSFSNGNVYRVPIPPSLRIQQSNDACVLKWNGLVGKAYQLQDVSDLTKTNWNDFRTEITATNALMQATLAITNSSQKFFRVLELP